MKNKYNIKIKVTIEETDYTGVLIAYDDFKTVLVHNLDPYAIGEHMINGDSLILENAELWNLVQKYSEGDSKARKIFSLAICTMIFDLDIDLKSKDLGYSDHIKELIEKNPFSQGRNFPTRYPDYPGFPKYTQLSHDING